MKARRWLRAFRLGLSGIMALGAVTTPARAQSGVGAAVIVTDGADSVRSTQPSVIARTWAELAAGSELERYARVAQLGGELDAGIWSVRAFGPIERVWRGPSGDHPWSKAVVAPKRRGWWLVRPAVEGVWNTRLPFSQHDGPMWSGRGGSSAFSAGLAARWGPITAQVAPTAWWTENRNVPLLPAAEPWLAGVRGDYAGGGIDLPQRLAPGPLGRVDPGESFLRIDALGVTAGISSAAEWWGPGVSSSLMLSNNAGGVPRIFAGTSQPVDIGIGRVHGRVIAGRLARSGEFLVPGAQLLSGVVGTFSPRGMPGLEIGGTRVFHSTWRDGGPTWRDLSIIWSPVAPNVIETGYTPGNQLASLFARAAFPGSGLEVYAEYAREDHNSFNNLDLITEPDHDAAVMFGFQRRIGKKGAPVWWAVRGETTNARMTHLGNVRTQVLFYGHGEQIAGHTLHGQLLGSPFVRGGSGSELGVDRYDHNGRIGVRLLRQGLATYAEGGRGFGALYMVDASMLRFTKYGEISARLGVVQRVGVTKDIDATSVNAMLGWRVTR